MSPTARTLKVLRESGWTAQVVERFSPFSKRRKDLFGCIDILALIKGRIVGIQACAGRSHAARRTKSQAEPLLQEWLKAGGLFVVWSWSKQGPAGKAKRWTFRIEGIMAGNGVQKIDNKWITASNVLHSD